MAYVTDNSSANTLARLGNQQGDHAGDVLVVVPGGPGLTAASASITICPEGIYGVTHDGRQFFAHSSGVVIIDAATDGSPAPGEPGQGT